MTPHTVLIVLGAWLVASVVVSLVLGTFMRAGAGHGTLANRVPRPTHEVRQPGETRSLAQLRARILFTELRARRRLRRSDLAKAA